MSSDCVCGQCGYGFGSVHKYLHISIGVFVVYIDNGNPVPNMPLRSHGLADENKKTFDRMEMIRKKRIKQQQQKSINAQF
jgi:hypothetical protein